VSRQVVIEGVPYNRYRVRWRLTKGSRRQMTVLSAGLPWLREEVCRELDARHGIDNVREGSCWIESLE
jgi:hypothetical protein